MNALSLRLLTTASTILIIASKLFGACDVANMDAATTSVIPSTGYTASSQITSNCPNQMWACLADPIGYPDADTSYAHTDSGGSHVIGFSGPETNLKAITMHIIAATNDGGSQTGTVQMFFYNG